MGFFSLKARQVTDKRSAQATRKCRLLLEPLEHRLVPADFTNINALLTGVMDSSVAWGDYNSDGHLDLAISGRDPGVQVITQIYKADGTGGYTLDTNANLTGVYGGSVEWGDYNNDGHLDLAICGETVVDHMPVSQVYTGDGNGGFALDTIIMLPGTGGALAWGDFNSDGDLDLVIPGSDHNNKPIMQFYEGDGKGGFTLGANVLLPGGGGSVAWGDYDSDGYLDLAIGGYTVNMPFTQVYEGDGTGGFTLDANAIPSGVGGSVAWGDYDSDGHLDLVIGGKEAMQVYAGDGTGGFTLNNKAFLTAIDFSRLAWGDCNSDGHLDLVISGREVTSGNRVTQVYTGDANGGFTLDANASLTGVLYSSVAWGDYNNDGRLDLVISGNETFSPDTQVTQVFQNTSGVLANSAPAAPTSLATSFPSSTSATFSWDAATDAETASAGLTYALRVGTTPGGADVVNPMANLSTGQRTISSFGLIQGTSYTLTGLTAGKTYFWGVQAIDSGLEGGAFAAEQSATLPGQGSPTFTSANKATFVEGLAGSFTVTASGSPTPTLTETGALPSGITFNAATGLLSGTPASGDTGAYALKFTASNGVGSAVTQNFTLTVGLPPAITSPDKTIFTVGAAGSFTVTATGFPAPNLSESGALPSGVTFNPITGLLSGTPAPGKGGTYPLTFTASNGAGPNATQSFLLTVDQGPAFNSANSTAFSVGTASSFLVTATGSPTPTLSERGALPSGVSFDAATSVLSGTPGPGTGGTYPVTFTASNGIGAAATQNFILTINQSSAFTSANNATFTVGTAGSFLVTATGFPKPTLSESGVLPSGVSFDAATGVLSGTPVAGTGGNYTLTFTASNGVGSNATQSFTLIVDQSPAFTSANQTTFVPGTAGEFTVLVTGFPTPVLAAQGAVPSGVSFDAATGLLSGTPAPGTGGIYPLTFTAGNGIGVNAVQSFTLTVSQAPAFTSPTSATFTVGTAGSFAITAASFPPAVLSTSSVLPAGVSFNSATGLLSGTPAAGVGGVDADVVQNFTLTVNQTPAITGPDNATFDVIQAGSFALTVSGFPSPVLSTQGAMPDGVSFHAATGLLSGTPAAGTGGTYAVTFTADNGIGAPAVLHFVLTVHQPLALASSDHATFLLGKPNRFTVSATGFPKPALFENGALPTGVTFDTSTGILSGSPPVGTDGTYSLTFTAQNGVGADVVQSFTLVVELTPNQHFMSNVYNDLLGHGPDPGGLAFWSGLLDLGNSRATVLNLFDHGVWYFEPLIQSVYQQFLGRTADAGGLAFWIERMRNGVSEQQLEASLIAAPEYGQHAGGTDRGWVDAMYQDLLGRQPDAQGELFWMQELARGSSRYSVAYGFAASSERQRQHIAADYQKFLGRSAGGSEIDYWLARFNQGAANEDITGLLLSDEYFKKGR
jgi:hypothetical protein